MPPPITTIAIENYIAAKTYQRWGKHEMPGDIAVDSITDYQMDALNGLKERLYRKRTQARLDTAPAERRQKRQEDKKRAGVQAVFDF